MTLTPAAARRIIPARAGFTGPGSAAGARGQDHPRSRGVYSHTYPSTAGSGGSSPLARGLRFYRWAMREGLRIIPARAGFTVWSAWVKYFRPDHPRSRGVYQEIRAALFSALGSSPLARGLLRGVQRDLGPRGIIPARAGFTRGRAPWAQDGRDHPRSRGVYRPRRHPRPGGGGSSPLARGLPRNCHWTPLSSGDHPRSRGVYRPRNPHSGSRPGSSPLARGLPSSP